jgi:hypothetical protein
VLLLPTLAALAGSAWAASHPADELRHGLVVHEASFGDALVTALVGGLVGLLLLVGLVVAGTVARYRVAGDRVWEVAWPFRDEQRGGARLTANGVALINFTDQPVNVGVLGHVEAVIRLPDGTFSWMAQSGMGGGPNSLTWPRIGPPQQGRYEVRWYATRQTPRLQEVARSRAAFDA